MVQSNVPDPYSVDCPVCKVEAGTSCKRLPKYEEGGRADIPNDYHLARLEAAKAKA